MGKSPKQLERYCKGIANHHRISILNLIHDEPGICVEDISKKLETSYKTVAIHTQKLVQAGLVNKRYMGKEMTQVLSPYGETFYKFLQSIK